MFDDDGLFMRGTVLRVEKATYGVKSERAGEVVAGTFHVVLLTGPGIERVVSFYFLDRWSGEQTQPYRVLHGDHGSPIGQRVEIAVSARPNGKHVNYQARFVTVVPAARSNGNGQVEASELGSLR